jgi:hypothetical protein
MSAVRAAFITAPVSGLFWIAIVLGVIEIASLVGDKL